MPASRLTTPSMPPDRAPSGFGDAARAALQRDGAVCLRGAVDAFWIDQLRRGVERNILEPGPLFRRLSEPDQPGGFMTDMWTRARIPEFAAFVAQSDIAALAAAALGEPRARLLQDTWFAKRAGTIERTPWHHDTVIFGPFLSIWAALDPIPPEAALAFVRGSHRWNRYFMPARYFETDGGQQSLREVERYYLDYHRGETARRGDDAAACRFEPTPDIDANPGAYDILSWDMQPGDCIVFNALTLHGAPGNPSAADARRFVTRWVGAGAVLAPHGESTVGALREHGFDVPFGVGDPIEGRMFPLLPASS